MIFALIICGLWGLLVLSIPILTSNNMLAPRCRNKHWLRPDNKCVLYGKRKIDVRSSRAINPSWHCPRCKI